ncbi:MAG: GNAT family N-acetyltransferase [Clostridia bacterium]|nr:GNAT family N-acetyltransferase [Clostridia bacterium]
MLTDVNRYKSSLKKLWADTFGDNEEYISLLFDCGYTPSECFAEIIDDEAVSALYLLTGKIKTGGKELEGRYLYAAATAESHRRKGLMEKLIKEAQEYVRAKGIAFISLVPANEELYRYYSKFGFDSLMYNYRSLSDHIGLELKGEIISPEDYLCLRNKLTDSTFSFSDNEWKYASSCLQYADYDFVRNTEDSCYIISSNGDEVLEYISSEDNYTANTRIFLSRLGEGTEIVSPYDLSDYCKCDKNKFGMIYFADTDAKESIRDDIYMNIALD